MLFEENGHLGDCIVNEGFAIHLAILSYFERQRIMKGFKNGKFDDTFRDRK